MLRVVREDTGRRQSLFLGCMPIIFATATVTKATSHLTLSVVQSSDGKIKPSASLLRGRMILMSSSAVRTHAGRMDDEVRYRVSIIVFVVHRSLVCGQFPCETVPTPGIVRISPSIQLSNGYTIFPPHRASGLLDAKNWKLGRLVSPIVVSSDH
jgi:hypothetical protein